MLFDHFREELLSHLHAGLTEMGANLALSDLILEYPPEPKMGDFAFPTFRLAKAMRKAPPVIASELYKKVQSNPAVTSLFKVEALGPYVNFSVLPETLKSQVLEGLLLSKDKVGDKTQSKPKTVILEFSSPNVAKAFNIYHLRGTMIGNSLQNIYKARGYNTVSINHLGDWGTQYGTLAVAYEMWGDDQELASRGIEYLVELYICINKEMATRPELKDKAREYFSKLEKGDPKISAYWKRFVDLSLLEFNKMYLRLHVHFDKVWGESFYMDKIEKVESLLKEKNLIIESEGAEVVSLESFGMPPCIIRKQDGSTIYATRDLAAAMYRYEKFQFDKMVYVVGAEQKLHFNQVFKVLELANLPWAKNCTHVDFGLYRFGDAKMSTRKGNFVTMEAVLDHAVERVKEIIKTKLQDKDEKISEKEISDTAEIIGVGAVVFNDLSTDRNTDVNFDLEKVLDFEGETGPYIQYAHTRCLSILRNAPTSLTEGIEKSKLLDLRFDQKGFTALFNAAKRDLKEEEELLLLRALAKMPLILDSVLETSKPSHLTSYLIDITRVFNLFYRTHKVLVEDKHLAQARLALVLATQRVLLKGLHLLAMRAPERM